MEKSSSKMEDTFGPEKTFLPTITSTPAKQHIPLNTKGI
jgi:hypothetical protein